MNNAAIAYRSADDEANQFVTDRLAFLEEERGKLRQIVEAINSIEVSEDWQKLKRLVLDDALASLERQLYEQALKPEIDLPSLYRLQGQLLWARKYFDLKKLGEYPKQQIENIKKLQHEQTNPSDGAL